MKKKTIRNVIASILVLVMTMALFAGCELAPTESKPAETDPPKVEALNYDLYYHANPAALYSVDKDETVHMSFYNKGKTSTTRVADMDVAAKIRHEMVGVFVKNDKGVVTDFKGVEEIGATFACKFAYITAVNADYTEVTVNDSTKLTLTSKTIRTDTTGKTSIGNTVKLRVGDCITAVADSNGDITHVFKVSAVAATKKAKCEDCGDEVTWTAWYGDNNALPTASGHYYLADDMLGKATTIAASATVVLDLNGHTIKTDGASRLISMNNGKNTFVLMDTSEGKTGTIVAAHGVGAVNGAFVWANKGSFKMYGGTVDYSEMTNNGYGAVYVAAANKFEMKGGTLKGLNSEFAVGGTGGCGGAVYVTGEGSKVIMTGGTIIGGSAKDTSDGGTGGRGGCILLGSKTVLEISGGEIKGGTANNAGNCVWATDGTNIKQTGGTIEDIFYKTPPVETPAEPATPAA